MFETPIQKRPLPNKTMTVVNDPNVSMGLLTQNFINSSEFKSLFDRCTKINRFNDVKRLEDLNNVNKGKFKVPDNSPIYTGSIMRMQKKIFDLNDLKGGKLE